METAVLSQATILLYCFTFLPIKNQQFVEASDANNLTEQLPVTTCHALAKNMRIILEATKHFT